MSIDTELISQKIVEPTGRIHLLNTLFDKPEEVEIFSLPNFSLGPLSLDKIDCNAPRVVPDEEKLPSYVVGRAVFESYSLIIDFQHNKLTLLESDADFKNSEYCTYSSVDLGASFLKEGIVVPVNINGEEVYFVLDIGSTSNYSAIGKEDEKIYLKSANPPLGYFYRCNFSFPVGIHGILGVPFFDENIVLIDFPAQKVFLITK